MRSTDKTIKTSLENRPRLFSRLFVIFRAVFACSHAFSLHDELQLRVDNFGNFGGFTEICDKKFMIAIQ